MSEPKPDTAMSDRAVNSYDMLIRHLRFRVPNKKVAVEPFPEGTTKPKVTGGVLDPMATTEVVALKVVFSSPGFNAGAVAYVRASRKQATTYGKEVFQVEGRKFILLPEDEVLVLDTDPGRKEPSENEIAQIKHRRDSMAVADVARLSKTE